MLCPMVGLLFGTRHAIIPTAKVVQLMNGDLRTFLPPKTSGTACVGMMANLCVMV